LKKFNPKMNINFSFSLNEFYGKIVYFPLFFHIVLIYIQIELPKLIHQVLL
jgi:hypothetical protein